MCQCASCKVTDALRDAGFAEWPRGNPTGAKHKAEYAAHVKACLSWAKKGAVPEFPAGIFTSKPVSTPRVDPHAHYVFGGWNAVLRRNIELPDDPHEYARKWAQMNHLRA